MRWIKGGLVALTLVTAGIISVMPASITPAQAVTTVTMFGDASGGPNGPWRVVSDSDEPFSVVRFTPSASFTFGSMTKLIADFDSTIGGGGGGSPRWSIALDDGGTLRGLLVNWGTSPGYNETAASLDAKSGLNVIGDNDAGRYDTSQFAGGSPFTDYNSAVALVGALQVMRFSAIMDSSWMRDMELYLNQVTYAFGGADQVVGGASTVPVPGAMVLFATGLGLLGWAGRRRKQQVAAAA